MISFMMMMSLMNAIIHRILLNLLRLRILSLSNVSYSKSYPPIPNIQINLRFEYCRFIDFRVA